jgi:allantoinase
VGLMLPFPGAVAGPVGAAAGGLGAAPPARYATYLASRPPEAEIEAIRLITRLCRTTRARTHVVHHSAAAALPLLREARGEGLPVTAETCPHYLHFAAEDIPDGATPFKCAPPIRERANREALWRALADGVLDLVASDHSPCSPALKAVEVGDFMRAWGGVAGLQLGLSVVWTEAGRRGHSLVDLARWMCAAPAALAGLAGRKGTISAGADADLVVFADDEQHVVRPEALHHRHRITPYAGETMRGVVHATFLRGELLAERGRALANDRGRLL